MKKIISYAAIALIGLIASPFAIGVLLLMLAAVAGIVVAGLGLIAVVIAWAVPLILFVGVAGLALYVISHLLDSW